MLKKLPVIAASLALILAVVVIPACSLEQDQSMGDNNIGVEYLVYKYQYSGNETSPTTEYVYADDGGYYVGEYPHYYDSQGNQIAVMMLYSKTATPEDDQATSEARKQEISNVVESNRPNIAALVQACDGSFDSCVELAAKINGLFDENLVYMRDVVVSAYDSSGNKTLKLYIGNQGSLYSVEHYTYDADGNMIQKKCVNSIGNEELNVEYTNGPWGILEERYMSKSQKPYKIVSYVYDENTGRKISASCSGSENWTKVYSYDDDGRLLNMNRKSDTGGCIFRYSYDQKGNQIAETAFEDGKSIPITRQSYDEQGNIVKDVYDIDDTGTEYYDTYKYDEYGRLMELGHNVDIYATE